MRLLTKEFYTLAELQVAWEMADQDKDAAACR